MPSKELRWIRGLARNQYVTSAGIIALTTGLGLLARNHLQILDIAMLFLLAVVVVSYGHPRGPALLASLLSIALFDFLFVPPYYTFDVHETPYFLTFGVMLAVALSMSRLTGRIREQAEDAGTRERRTATLYQLSRELGAGRGVKDQIAIAVRHISEAGHGRAHVHLHHPDDTGADHGWPDDGVFENVAVRVAATWAYERSESAGWGTRHCADAEALVVPLRSPSRTLGVVVLEPVAPEQTLAESERLTVEALVEQAATSFERALLAEGREQARMEVESERLRTALLSSLSHDLRTPLASIEGAGSSLVQDDVLPREVRREMAETIVEESRRMTRLITNLLDMVRVETGALAVRKAWQPLEEAVGVVLLRLEERLATHPVEIRLPAELPLVPIDEVLVEQVFINLLENAVKHTPPGTPVTITAWADDEAVTVEVADRGPGVAPGEDETIFRKFYRGSSNGSAGPTGGSGLGLTICRGIITAHRGRLWLQRGNGTGATFRFTLPLDGPPMAAPPAEMVTTE